MNLDIFAIIITSFIGFMFVILGIYMLGGKGGILIAGYNTMSAMKKARIDEVSLCKFIGKIVISVGVLCPLMTIAIIFNISWLAILLGLATLGLCLFAVIYSNTANRFQK